MPKITMPKGQVQMVSLYNLSTTVQYKSKKAAPTTSDKGKNNKIIVVDKDGNKIPVKGITGMNIKFAGDNNYLGQQTQKKRYIYRQRTNPQGREYCLRR